MEVFGKKKGKGGEKREIKNTNITEMGAMHQERGGSWSPSDIESVPGS